MIIPDHIRCPSRANISVTRDFMCDELLRKGIYKINLPECCPLPASCGQPKEKAMKTEKAMFGAGCFWGVESSFRQVEGVVDASVGYSGGSFVNPAYEDVCTGKTGHAEVVLVEYDPARLSYQDLLEVFWEIHDPTTPNRQGPDRGSQYRSVIFFYTPEQERDARESMAAADASGRFRRSIVTEINPAGEFYRAEEYHQRYNEKHGRLSCG